MPKIKANKKYVKTYSEEILQKALEEIKSGGSKKSISSKYGIPRATLQFRLGPKFKKTEIGRNTYLSKEEEEKIVNWILESHRKGFPRRKIDVQISVKAFIDSDNRPNPFKDNTPGDHWYSLFLKRHPILSERTPEGVTSSSANVSEKDIRGWFKEIEAYLRRKDYMSILEDPARVFNGDETCFHFCPKLGKVIAPKGTKNAYEVDMGEAKKNLTVMFTFSALGDVTPPMIIFPNKRFPKAVSASIPGDWGMGLSDNGWMKSDIFVDYIEKVLYPYLKTANVKFPIIMFLDGHSTHLTYQLSELCSKLEIILISLYPNSTRILQPADVAGFRPLKSLWKQGVLDWRRKNPFCKLGKEHFAPILKQSIESLEPKTIISGFRACGLYPWNPNSIDFSKCLGKQHKIVPDENSEEKKEVSADASEKEEKNNILTYEQFTDIVGQWRIEELSTGVNTSCLEEFCGNFSCLQNIYRIFKPRNEPIPKRDDIPEQSIVEIDVDLISESQLFSEADIDHMPITFEEQNTNHTSNDNVVTGNNITILQNIVIPRGFEERRSIIGVGEVPDSTDLNFENIPLPVQKTILKEDYQQSSSINDEILEVPEQPKIENYLMKPQTPQRKGKIQSKRSSFVITSTQYKKDLEEKAREKQEKETKKEENKRKRLLKQASKKGSKRKRGDISKENSNNTAREASVSNDHQNHIRNLFQEDSLNLPDELDAHAQTREKQENETKKEKNKRKRLFEQASKNGTKGKRSNISKNNEYSNKTPKEALVSNDNQKHVRNLFQEDSLNLPDELDAHAQTREKQENETKGKRSNISKNIEYSNKTPKEALVPNDIQKNARNLFQEDSVSLPDDLDAHASPTNLPINNVLVTKGLCFICTNKMHFTNYNIGIKCQKCTRSYHVKCLKKYDKYEENFQCDSCKRKINEI